MEQMEQLLPRGAQDHLRNSCKFDEKFWRWRWGVVHELLRETCGYHDEPINGLVLLR